MEQMPRMITATLGAMEATVNLQDDWPLLETKQRLEPAGNRAPDSSQQCLVSLRVSTGSAVVVSQMAVWETASRGVKLC